MKMRHPSARRAGLSALLAGALALALPAVAQTGPAPGKFEVKDKGKGWQLLAIKNAERLEDPPAEVWMVSREGLASLPVTEFERADLAADFESGDPQATVLFVEKAMLETTESGEIPPGYERYVESESAEGGCSGWTTKTKDYDFQFDEWSQDRQFDLPGGLDGNFQVNVPLDGNAHLTFVYKYKKRLCIPYKFKFVSARTYGNLIIGGDSDVTASFGVSGQWSKEWKLFQPEIFDATIWVGPIPVYVDVSLPTYAGFRLEASLSGSVGYDTDLGASGTFDYSCTPDDCTGSNTLGDVFDAGQITGSASLDAEATAHARVMARVSVYGDMAYVEAGLKGYVEGDLWGYYGNACGDADADGHNETVRALAADLAWGYDIVYGIGGWLLPDRSWTRTGDRYPLGWRDLLGHGQSTALQPMLRGPLEVERGQDATYTVKMRPCYPYSERVNFTIQPGTWNGRKYIPKPKSTIASENSSDVWRSFSTTGPKTLTVTNGTDANGRNIGVSYSRTIQVVEPPCGDTTPPTVTLTAPAEGSRVWGNVTLSANASDNVGVTRVQFQVNGENVCVDQSAPWSCTVDLDSRPTGDYAFRARAFDACENVRASAEVQARIVSNPELWLDQPSSGATVSGTQVPVYGWATDPDGVPTVSMTLDNQVTVPVTYRPARPDVCQAVPVSDPDCPNVGFGGSFNSTLYANGAHSLRIVATDASGRSSTFVRNFTIDNPPAASCTPSSTSLCLRENRFKVQVNYVNGSSGGAAQARPYSAQAGFFSFFGDQNLEVGVKVLGPANGSFWVYSGAATHLEYTLTVTDTQTGQVKTYVKPLGSFCGQADTQAFPAAGFADAPLPELAEGLSFEPAEGLAVTSEAPLACTPSSTALCLLGDRYRVEVLRGGVAQAALELTPQTGTFMFSAPGNTEVFVKVLDGTGVNGRIWVFYGSLTDRDFTLRVTDTQTGAAVEYVNPLGNYCGAGHTDAF